MNIFKNNSKYLIDTYMTLAANVNHAKQDWCEQTSLVFVTNCAALFIVSCFFMSVLGKTKQSIVAVGSPIGTLCKHELLVWTIHRAGYRLKYAKSFNINTCHPNQVTDVGAHCIGWVHYDTKIPYGRRGCYNALTNGSISKIEIVTKL